MFKRSNFIYVVIIVLASITGIIAIESNSDYILRPDSTGYHNMAINILETGKHTDFFREPGYPYFLAFSYKVFSIFGGNPSRLLPEDYKADEKKITLFKPEIKFAKYMQLFILILSIILFFSTIKLFFSEKISNYTGILSALFYPFFINSIYLLREPFLAFLITICSYLIAQYFLRKNIIFILAATFIIGISALTFQAILAFYIIIPIAIVINNKDLKSRSIKIVISIAVFLITICPWCYNVYNYYPDIRIVKTMGCSLTFEGVSYVLALRNIHKEGIINDQQLTELEHKNWYDLEDQELFERSFNGWYSSQADSLNSLMNVSTGEKLKNKVFQLTKYFTNIFIHKDYSPLSTFNKLTTFERIIRYILVLLSLGIAFFSFWGLLFFPKSKLIYFMPQSMFIVLFFILGSENRRVLPMVPFIIFLFIYFFVDHFQPILGKIRSLHKRV